VHRYLIIIEATSTGYSAYSPDLPGCIAAGASQADVERVMREAIELHLAGLRDAGLPIPVGGTSAAYVEVAA
jgi:predicted RNase H-like HicB family nuclease